MDSYTVGDPICLIFATSMQFMHICLQFTHFFLWCTKCRDLFVLGAKKTESWVASQKNRISSPASGYLWVVRCEALLNTLRQVLQRWTWNKVSAEMKRKTKTINPPWELCFSWVFQKDQRDRIPQTGALFACNSGNCCHLFLQPCNT